MINRLLAELIFLLHAAVVAIALFGWVSPITWPLYMGILAAVLISDVYLGYCILSKWEFDLRKESNPKINYHYNWTTYYTYRITRNRISDTFFLCASMVYVIGSLAINIYFHLPSLPTI